jgi:hypothetical protein
MKTPFGPLDRYASPAALAMLALAGCTHYWERPGGTVTEFERESAACIEEARQDPLVGDAREQIYRACMRARGWNRVEASVGEDNQFRGPEDSDDFSNPPPALGGRRYQKR